MDYFEWVNGDIVIAPDHYEFKVDAAGIAMQDLTELIRRHLPKGGQMREAAPNHVYDLSHEWAKMEVASG